MTTSDVRWKQRFENYKNALPRLTEAINLFAANGSMSGVSADLMQEGLIQRFEFTQELAWKVMKDYAEYQGYTDIRGSRDAFRKALEINLIDDSDWMKSINDRNLSSHDYDKDTADSIFRNIIDIYYPLFMRFERTMQDIAEKERQWTECYKEGKLFTD